MTPPPEHFTWGKVIDLERFPTAIIINELAVCRLVERLDGSWFVQLDYHVPPPSGRATHPGRDCATYETGRAGCEVWATRHWDRLLAETAELSRRRDEKLRGGR